ncbi:hypothetical protein, partial [Amycolatopsis sp. NPDC000740]
MSNLPDSASIVDLAKAMGVSDADIANLPNDVKQLTKGQLLALWGAGDTAAAASAYSGGTAQAPTRSAGGDLNL